MPDEAVAQKDYLEMIQDPDVNFYSAQTAFNKYWANRTDYKGNGWKVFKRWEYIHESRVLPDGKLQAPDYILREYNRYMSQVDGQMSAGGNWSIEGPVAYPTNNTGQPTGMGRINAIAFHPTDAGTFYAGAPSGGFWKTTDGGSTWSNLSSNLPTLGVSSILIHPSDPNIIYLGTGDRDAGDAPGIGVYKSTNGGSTWAQVNNGLGSVTVGAMIMHPSDPTIIYAATSSGIYKTTTSGTSWVQLMSGNFKDIKFKPGDPTVIYAVTYGSSSKFYRTANSGTSWSLISAANGVPLVGSRMVIGTSAANPSYVYLVQISATNSTFAALLKSTNSGLTFTTQSTGPNIFDYACDGSGTSTQATYDLCITVDPNNANTIYVGSINNWKSTDGGVNWNISSMWAGTCSGTVVPVHADQHCYEWSPLNGKLYVGNDGGISWTGNGGTNWTEISGGLAISQVYKIGQGAGNQNYTLIGLQDNGSAATLNGSAFYTTRGGDGTECMIDYSNSNYCYNTYIKGDISRSTSGPTGSYSNIASTGTHGITADESGSWVTPYLLHKTDATIMFAGYENVWRTTNVKTSPASSVTWSAISTGETSVCKVLEQSAADVNILYVVRTGSMKRTDNANDAAGSVTWTTCTLPGGNTPTDLETHPTNASIVYATANYYVYKSTDKGATWTNISGNLPALFTNTLVYDKNTNEGLYVGNQTGVWYKDASMTNWALFTNGLPPVDVRELEIYYDAGNAANNRIKAGTYGRALWQSDLIQMNLADPTGFTALAASTSQIGLSWTKNGASDDVLVAWSPTSTFGVPADGTAYTAGNTLPSGGGTVIYKGSLNAYSHSSLTANTTYYYKIWSVNGSNQYSAGLPAVNNTTDCSPVSTLPYGETFDNPTCWRTNDNTGQGNWQFGSTSTPALTAPYAYFSCEYGVAHNYSADLISPPFDLSSYSTARLSFNQYFDASGTYASSGKVYYSINNGNTWSLLATWSSDSPNPESISLSVSGAAGQSQVKFKWTYTCTPTGAYLWAVDDIAVTECAGIWTGATNTDWHTPSNWCNNTVPSATTDIIIPTGVTNMPYITSTSPAYCRDILISMGASLRMGANTTLEVKGNWTCNGSFDYSNSSGSAVVKFNGSSAQTVGGSSNTLLNRLTIDNPSGITLIASGKELRADNITLTNGMVTTGTNKVNLSGGTLTRTNGYVNGTLQKYVWTNVSNTSTITYEIGTATSYLPVVLNFPAGSITSASGLAIKMTTGDHASLSSSTLNSNKSVNRYWSFPTASVTFSSCSAVFNFLPGDLDAAANTTNLLAGKYASSSWTYPTVGTKTSTSTQVMGLTSATLGDIQLAEGPKASITAGGHWSNPATWNPAAVPDATDNVTITSPGTVVVDVNNATCNNLALQGGAKLEINPTQALTVNGTLTNGAGTAGLVLKSDVSSTGSLIHSTPETDGTVERYMNNAEWTNGADGWHFLASPVEQQAISPAFTTDPYDFYAWYEPLNLWVNFKNNTTPPTWNTANGSTDFTVGKGYLADYDEAGIKSFTGKLNVEDVQVSGLTITGAGTNRSWHLLGNPYGSALTWDASAEWELTNIAGVAKIWNEANQSYSDLSSTPASVIPATNGFMVQVNSGAGSLKLPASKRVHSAVPFYKNSSDEIQLKAISVEEGNAQESKVILMQGTSPSFDPMYDGEFLPGYAPMFYSTADNRKLSTCAIPEITSETIIPFGFVKNDGSNFRIEASGVETLPEKAYLQDLKTGVVTDLSLTPVYSFTSEEGDNAERFLLKFGFVGIPGHEQNTLQVWYSQNKLFLLNTHGEVFVEIYNIAGQKEYQCNAFSNPVLLSLVPGIHFARVTSEQQVKTVKFFVGQE